MAYLKKKNKCLPQGDEGRARSVTATHQTLPGFQSTRFPQPGALGQEPKVPGSHPGSASSTVLGHLFCVPCASAATSRKKGGDRARPA